MAASVSSAMESSSYSQCSAAARAMGIFMVDQAGSHCRDPAWVISEPS